MVTLQSFLNCTSSKMSSTSNQQYSLRWNNYVHHITYAFDSLRSHEDLVDVTLCCEGRKIRAHKILLSACSTYFKDVFKENPCQHPVIVFKNVKYDDLLAIIQFMYQGEVNVQQDSLPSFLNTAEMLSVQGLTDTDGLNTGHPTNKCDSETSNRNAILTHKIMVPNKCAETKESTYTLTTTEKLDVGLSVDTTKIQSITISQDPESITPITTIKTSETLEDEDEDISYIEGEELERTNIEMPDESTTQYLKMEIPEYIDVVENPNNQEIELSDTIKMSGDTNKEDDEYKVIDSTDSDIEIIYSDSNRDSTLLPNEIGQMLTVHQNTSDHTIINKQLNNTDQASNIFTETLATAQRHTELKCTYCGRTITSLAALKRHIESKHTKMNSSFTCSICQKLFKTKWSLSTHFSRFHRKTYLKTSLTASTTADLTTITLSNNPLIKIETQP